MPYEDDYKMWLEKSLIEMNPDWVCDDMVDKEFTHKWCEENCGKDNAYIMPKCLHMYYHHIARADRKTESNSEKPNNSTISKMEQVEDEPQTEEHCETCRHKDKCEGATYEYKNTEWWCLGYAPIEDEPQTDCAWGQTE